jgi:hypothetical protein
VLLVHHVPTRHAVWAIALSRASSSIESVYVVAAANVRFIRDALMVNQKAMESTN